MKKAACVFLYDQGKILCVSRGNDLQNFGLPGGGVEKDESFLDAAKRETFEETGIDVWNLEEFHLIPEKDGVCKIFTCKGYKGKLKKSPEGIPKWLTPQELMKRSKRFKEENKELIDKFFGEKEE